MTVRPLAPRLRGEALLRSRSHTRIRGAYYAMETPPVAGLTVESVEAGSGLRIRFSDGSLLSVSGGDSTVLYLAAS